MTVYLILLAGVFALAPLCNEKFGKYGRLIYCIILGLGFTYISANRFNVGFDYVPYATSYFRMKYIELEELSFERMEKGLMVPFYICNTIWENYQAAFVVSSLLIYPAVFTLIYKKSSAPWMSAAGFLCLGLFFNSLCFLRQFIAAIIITYGFRYALDKIPWKFFVMVIAAATFHWSALFVIPLYIFLRIKPTIVYHGLLIAVSVVLFIFSRDILLWFCDNSPLYSTYSPETSKEAFMGLDPIYTIMFFAVYVVAFVFRKRLMEKNPLNAVYINLLLFTVIIEFIGIHHAIVSRLALCVYIPPVIWLLPDMFIVVKEYISEKCSSKGLRSAVASCTALVTLGAAAGVYVTLIANNYNGVNPYIAYSDRSFEAASERVYSDEEAENIDSAEEKIAQDELIDEYGEDEFDEEFEMSDEEINELNDAIIAQLS